MKKFLLIGLLLLIWGAAYSQATVSPDPPAKVNACGGLPNGSISFTISAGTGPFSILYFGLGFGQNGVIPATVGVPVVIPALQADSYLLAISDGDAVNPNYSTFVTISNIPAVSAVLNSKTDNSSCTTPNGQVSVTASGGTGTYSYAWTSNNGFGPFPDANFLTGLPGGQYSVDITDPGSNCAFHFGPITVNDPSPVVQTVTTASPEIICSSAIASISLAATQVLTLPGAYYEVLKNGTPTGVKASGTGGGLTLNLPAGTFANGDVLTVRAVDGLCTPAIMSGSVTLTVNPSPTAAVLSGTTTICSATPANLKVNITGGTGPFTITIDNGVGTINNYVSGANIPVSPTSTTTYNLLSVVDASGCPPPSLTGTATVTVNSGPTSGVISGTATICRGTPTNLVVTITGGTGPYSFTINNAVGLKTNYVSGTPIPVSPTVNRTYSIVGVITDANGCTVAGTGSAIVTVNIPPTSATLSLNGTGTICAGQSTSLKVVVVGGTGPFTFTITGLGLQTGYVSGTPIAVNPAITTSYSLVGNVVTDSKTCTVVGTGTVNVTVNPLPTATLGAAPPAICPGGSSTLTFTMTGTPPFNVQYSDGTTTSSFSTASLTQTVPVNPVASTTYTVTSITDATTCPGPTGSNALVTVNTPPSNATISGTTTVCSSTSTNLAVTITGGVSPYTITINNGVGTLNNYISGTSIPVTPAGTTTYSVTAVSDANGCAATALSGSAIVTVNPSPTAATLGGTAIICAGSGPTSIFATITGGASPFTITLDNGVGTISNYVSGTAIPVNPSATTTYSFVGNITDANGCGVTSASTVVVSVNTPPSNAVLSGTTAICPAASTNLAVTITGGTSPYTVTIDNGVGAITSYVSGAPISVSPAATTTFGLVSVTDANGCPAAALTGTAVITLNSPPSSAALSGSTSICAGLGPVNLTVTITGGVSPYSFVLDNGVGAITGYVSGNPIPVNPTSTTTYAFVGTLNDANGCPVIPSGTATVTISTPPTSAVLSGTTSICPGSTTNLSVAVTGGIGPYTFTIDNGVGTINNYASGSPIPVSPAAGTTYSITGVVTDASGCSVAGSGSAVITITTPPSNAMLSGTTTICSGSPANLAVAITGGTGPYNVTIDNGVGIISGYATGAPIAVNPVATTTYSLVSVTDANGCSAQVLSGTAVIGVKALATAAMSGGGSVCVGATANLSVALSGTGPWDIVYTDGSSNFPVNGIVSATTSIPVNPLISTSYSLVSVVDAGCGPGTVSGSATVTVSPIGGNPATFGMDSWLGYVYDDSGDATPIPARINFAASKYRGVIDETDIAGMTPFSTYNTGTDEFDLNISNNATGLTVHSAAMCGTYNDSYSVRFRMKKIFAQGVYVFTVGGDDGVRMTLDGVTIIPGGFVNQSYTTYTSPAQCLTAGTHDLVIEYFENTGFSRVSFAYQVAAPPIAGTPLAVCVNDVMAPTLTASSADPLVTGYKWYKDNTLTTVVGTGSNFTPGAADLDLSVAGTTSFFVTATYPCGETIASQVDVNVVSTATILPVASPSQICQAGGVIDLRTLVTVSPAGGFYSFTGTGVTSPNFDPSLVTGTTSISLVYSSGSCNANASFNLDVVTAATVNVPSSTTSVCQTGTPVDLTTLVSATPSGGVFTFTGPGVSGTTFDPSAQSGPVAVTVGYLVPNMPGGCTDSKTINFDVISTVSIFTNNGSTCPTAGPFDLTSLVSGSPAGGSLTFSGPGVSGTTFDPTTHANSSVTITVGYALGTCATTATLSVAVSSSCTATGVGCGAFTVAIDDTRPSCSNPVDGIIAMHITGGVPPYIVSLTDGSGFNKTLPGANPVFSSLSPATYTYTITDSATPTNNTCSLPFSLPVNTSVQATAANFIAATCFNQPTGGATITVTSGGAAPYEYSGDGGATWTVFTSPATVTNLMGSSSAYSILVRDDAADLCPAQVLVNIPDGVEMFAPYTPTAATCANNDGALVIGTISGGVAPYSFVMDGVPFAALPAANTFTGLAGGAHVFSMIDASSCQKNFSMVVPFPGLVDFSTSTVNPDCLGNGTNGSLTVLIASVGTFEVGISTDSSVPPATFQNIISDGTKSVAFNNLGRGTYYVNAQSVGAQCPTVTAVSITGGPDAVDFTILANNIVCFGDNGGVTLQGITGSSSLGYSYEILQLGNPVQSGTISVGQALGDVPFDALPVGTYQIRLFQDQSTVNGCVTPITSAFKPITVVGPTAELDTLSLKKTISYPDLPTGALVVAIKESGEAPYEVKLVSTLLLDPDKSFALDWSEAARNGNNLLMEYSVKNLYAGEYVLSIRDSLGCEKSYPVTIGVDGNIFIPNVFTPNGDMKNEMFYIRNKPAQTSVVITNRWGKEVYRNGDYDNAWTADGIEDGVYYYQIKANGQVFNGWLEVQRGQ